MDALPKKQNPIREKEINILTEICDNYEPFKKLPANIKKIIIVKIEKSILNASIDEAVKKNLSTYWENTDFLEIYNTNSYRVKTNLDIDSYVNKNKKENIKCYLIKQIYNYAKLLFLKHLQKTTLSMLDDTNIEEITKYVYFIDPEALGNMDSLKLNPMINKEYIDELELRNEQKLNVKYSEMYKCGNCGKRKTKQRQVQTRSADEGSTLFITCIECNHEWRIYG
jgi:DNA-directed RNA polymerase subunit M/transcription elongation factor TFIIS